MKLRLGWVVIACLSLMMSGFGQNSPVSSPSLSVPPIIQFSNMALDEGGTPLSGTVSITFSLYNSAVGAQVLWSETQNVQLGNAGQFSVYLGLTQANGIPINLFTSGEAHWLGVKIAGQPEQPRVFLVSVPYAMKAGDAATVGGLPASAFVLAAPNTISPSANSSAANAAPGISSATSSDVTTSGGTVGSIPLWDAATDIDSSVITQSGSGSTAKIGINNTTPATTLDVKGSGTIRGTLSTLGTLSLPATGAATSSGGKNSEPMTFTASAYNSGTSTAVNQTFEWQAEPAGNDTSSASGTLNLLFGQGTSKPAETGFHIASDGLITFATGQIFPGTGDGTVTSVASGTGLTGGPITSSGTLQIDPTVVPELAATSNTFTGSITASSFTGSGAGLTNVNAATLNGFTSNAFQPAGSYATLGANTFTGNQTVTGNVTASGNLSAAGVVAGSGFEIGSTLFDYGTPFNGSTQTGGNAFLGFAGNTTTTGILNAGAGLSALGSNTTGKYNTGIGNAALYFNTSGGSNTAVGSSALSLNNWGNTTGSGNTALGASAGFGYDESAMTQDNNTFLGANTAFTNGSTITNATAIGANAMVTESNAMVLGPVTGNNGGTSVKVGIGTTAPAYSLDVHGTGNFTGNVTFASSQTFPGTGTITGVTAGTGLSGGGTSGGVTLTLASNACAAGSAISALPFTCSPFATLGANTFAGNQTVSGNVSATGAVSGSSFQIGSNLFDYGSYANGNALLGFGGNTTMSGTANTVVGLLTLRNTTTGWANTANGYGALEDNTTGTWNTASGDDALVTETTGSFNTAIGGGAGVTADDSAMTGSNNTFLGDGAYASTGTLTNATAVGSLAEVGESNALVLGSINGVNQATASTNVGIGTTTPQYTLHVIDHGPGGIYGFSNIIGNSAVYGQNTATSGSGTNGGTFYTASPAGAAVVGVNQASDSVAAYFGGNVTITGNLSKGSGSFKIDDPLDPANKYLYHSFVESPDMMNIYNGNVTTDEQGLAVVLLPEYFEALNRDFRYQLTVMAQFAQAIVEQKVTNNRFVIKTDKPTVEVSWQVTGIRQDAYAKAHPVPVEVEKPEGERGHYLHPELFGAPEQDRIGPPR